MKELIRVRVQYSSRQQCCKTHKWPLPLPLLFRQIFEKSLNIKFNENPSSGSRVIQCGGRTDRKADRRDEASSRFSELWEKRLKAVHAFLWVSRVHFTKKKIFLIEAVNSYIFLFDVLYHY